MNADLGTGEHLTGERLAAYVDGTLRESELADLERHLAGCRDCRAELLDVVRVLRGGRTRRRMWLASTAAAAIAIAGLTVTLAPHGIVTTGDPAPIVRNSPAEGVLRMEVLGPSEGARVTASAEFKWVGAGTNAFYRLTVTDVNGDEVWSGTTTDSTLALSEIGELSLGEPYFWYVDALLPDGRTATTGVHRFEVEF